MPSRALAVVTVLVFYCNATVWSADVPPYPYEIPASYEKVSKRLRENLEKPCSFAFDFQKTTVRAAIEEVAASIGEKVAFDLDVRLSTERDELRVKDLPAKNVLRWLLSSTGVGYLVTEKGLVITDRPEKYPIVEKLKVRNGLYRVRISRFPTRREVAERKKGEKEWKKKDAKRKQRAREIREKLRSTQVSRDFVDLPLPRILAGLSRIAGVAIVDGASREKPELKNKKLSVKGESRSVEKVLHSVLAPLQLDYELEENCCVVRPREIIEEIRTNRELQKKIQKKVPQTWEKKQREILSRSVTLNPRNGTRLGSFIDDLSRQLALPVYTDRDAWRTRLSFRRTTRPATFQFNDIARALKRKGVEVAVDLDERVVEQGGGYDSFALYILKPGAW